MINNQSVTINGYVHDMVFSLCEIVEEDKTGHQISSPNTYRKIKTGTHASLPSMLAPEPCKEREREWRHLHSLKRTIFFFPVKPLSSSWKLASRRSAVELQQNTIFATHFSRVRHLKNPIASYQHI